MKYVDNDFIFLIEEGDYAPSKLIFCVNYGSINTSMSCSQQILSFIHLMHQM